MIDLSFMEKIFYSDRKRLSKTCDKSPIWDIPTRLNDDKKVLLPYKQNKNCPNFFREAIVQRERDIEIIDSKGVK